MELELTELLGVWLQPSCVLEAGIAQSGGRVSDSTRSDYTRHHATHITITTSVQPRASQKELIVVLHLHSHMYTPTCMQVAVSEAQRTIHVLTCQSL